jgi:hypothetical protein
MVCMVCAVLCAQLFVRNHHLYDPKGRGDTLLTRKDRWNRWNENAWIFIVWPTTIHPPFRVDARF